MREDKRCRECGEMFPRPMRRNHNGGVRMMDVAKWARRVYCSNACKVKAYNNGRLRF